MSQFTGTRIILLFCLHFIPYVLGSQCECDQEIDDLRTIAIDLANEIEEMKESNKKKDEDMSFLKESFSEMKKRISTLEGWKVCNVPSYFC